MAGTPLARLAELKGGWTGTNRLWLRPDEPAADSEMHATITPVLGGRFVRLDYTWAADGGPQEGSILFGYEEKQELVTAVWIDTWHMGDKAMSCVGEQANDRITVRGSYRAPTGPDWGWWTEIELSGPDAFVLRMFNVTPDGMKMRAAEAALSRAAAGTD